MLDQHHLEGLLREFVDDCCHVARPHQCLGGDTAARSGSPPDTDGPTKPLATPVLGGLHHRYVRVADCSASSLGAHLEMGNPPLKHRRDAAVLTVAVPLQDENG